MSLSSEAQALFDHARNSLPRWLTSGTSAALEWLYGFTAIFDATRVQGQNWIDITYLNNATGIELDQHAIDRGTFRQNAETDNALRERLRNISDALTEPALLTGVDAILDSTGQLADFRVQQYVTTGWTSEFEGDLTTSAGGFQTRLTLSMVSDGTNPPTLIESGGATTIHFSAGVTTRAAVESLITSSSTYFHVKTASASGATALAAGDAFSAHGFYLSRIVGLRRDRGHVHAVGSCHAFASRGYRMTGKSSPMAYIFILPYGTSAATALSVGEYLRKNGPAGYAYFVERRLNP